MAKKALAKEFPSSDQAATKVSDGKSTIDDPKEGTSEYYLKRDYTEDLEAHDKYIDDFDAYEAMVMSKTYDSVSKQTKSGITDGSTTTLYIERAARVVGQLPTGNMEATGKKDTGKAMFMDIIRQKYIYPNANAQFPFLVKIRLWQFYSSVYGNMPMFVDWNVAPNGYIGPDCWLWSPRNFIPQNGRVTVADMDYCHALVYVTPGYIEDLIADIEEGEIDEKAGWNLDNLQELLKLSKNATHTPDTRRDTFIRRQRQSDSSRELMFATRFEAGDEGKWITFAPDYGYLELRNTDNPHGNNRIPFVTKASQPLFDSFYGLGDFQRAKPIQFALDGLTNFYFEGIKMNIYPPTVVNANGVVKHTISQTPGAIWQETIPNSARRLETSTAGLSTFQSAASALRGSLLNQAGTTDTTVNQASANDPGFGKTPQALQALQQRESTRDNQDRFFLEQALEELINLMISLIPNMATEAIPVNLFADEVEQIKDAGYDDIIDMLEVSESGSHAKLKIKPSALKGVEYRFILDSGTTAKADKEAQKQALVDFLGMIGKFQNELDNIRQQTGMGIDWSQIFKTYGELTDVPNMNKLWVKIGNPTVDANGTPLDPQTGQPVQTGGGAGMPNAAGGRPPSVSIAYKDVEDPNAKVALLEEAIPGYQGDPNAIAAAQATAAADKGHQVAPAGGGGTASPIAPFTVGKKKFVDPAVAAHAQAIQDAGKPTAHLVGAV